MVNVIGVRFQNAGKLYFFDPGSYWPTPGDFVVVETARGIEFGEVVTSVREINDELLQSPLKKVVRVATAEDIQHAQENKAGEKEAYAICQKKIAEHKLDMKLVSVEYTFDNSKILFYFTANGRVDFRSLVKDLAAVFKTRIELRQIGVRDEAKMLGGLGPCGRPICCGAFLGDFQPVSIKMAKEQNLSLNPTKISGVCGRLMCCLKYEQDNYEQTRKRMPKVGKEVITPDGPGVVWDLNIIKETVRVRIQKGDSSELKDYPVTEIQRPGQQLAPVAKEEEHEEIVEVTPELEAIADEEAHERQPKQPKPKREQNRPRKDKPAQQNAEGEKGGKSAQRENQGRKQKDEGENRGEGKGEGKAEGKGERNERRRQPKQNAPQGKPNAEHEKKDAAEPRQETKPEVKQEPKAEVKAEPKAEPKKETKPEAASPWKAAVERALRAAQGDE